MHALKHFLKYFVFLPLVRIDLTWHTIRKTVLPLAGLLKELREHEENCRLNSYITEITPQLTILNGPFRGVRYPALAAHGSALYPKLLGSYERELHPLIRQLLGKIYTDIVDIGCAEGYYAIGMAKAFPMATVHAFDIDESSRLRCSAMAKLNDVEDRVQVQETCTRHTLIQMNLGECALIISDCEGYESELFDAESVFRLRRHDFLIEVHDCLQPGTSLALSRAFHHTHTLTVYRSISDAEKVTSYKYAELAPFSPAIKYQLLREGRRTPMEWFYFSPKIDHTSA